jgi:hypothetical protein
VIAAVNAADISAQPPIEDNRPLVLGTVTPDRTKVPRYGKVEFTLDLQGTYGNAFDPQEIEVYGIFHPPDGKSITVPGFFFQDYTHELKDGQEVKQTLQIADFMGYNENAVRWQIWTALLVYILLRFIAWQSGWKHSFTRLFTSVRAILWKRVEMFSALSCCGTAYGTTRIRAAPEQCYLPGFSPGLSR